ncbi:LysR family transcriptional regulator [Alicyclobacillus macrosporangiidus]|uniref:ModE molybdate transport repressor domain-containing protein n=1 Tax=Alicyclobacillus macrosporangiidus TaxID=392015 RepID=A0A1I7FEA3_9BACL|nr:LysR family transcriptional regulator [Alicyclobacillus macrosporangiidus]SFU34474.1 ModE molybdate transport repressor domain-containing protein [Alicyclobacillus macrosporangiidus]
MDTKDVTLFLTIARLGSISRTAEQLFMSQSTVTHHLQRLERALGYTLFHRTPGGVQLTAEGQRLVPLAERMAALERMMLHPDEEQTPVVRVLSGRAFVSVDVPACLSRVVRQMKVHLKVRMGLYDDMVDALLSQQVDFCFLGEPIYHPLVRQVEFLPDAIDLVVPADHYFTHEFPGVQAIAGEPYIAFGRSRAPFRQRVERLLAKAGVYPQVRMELDSIDGVKAMVSHGLGISLLPRRTLNDAAYKGYRAIPLPGDDWVRPTLLAYPAAHAERTLTHRFVEIVRQYYDELKQSSS